MKKVAIIGVGLMGGSLGLALKRLNGKNKKQYEILGIGRNAKKLQGAQKLGAIDSFSVDISAVKDCDIVFICSPVDTVADIYKTVAKFVKKSAVIADLGSIKESIEVKIGSLRKRNKNFPEFVGCHPMAGTEHSGVDYAEENLYEGAITVITSNKNAKGTKAVAKIWKDAGCKIIYMDAKEHDKYVAFTSHLPHIIAFVYYRIFKEKSLKDKNIKNLTAGSFNSITRVAKSSPEMWLPIFLNNKKNLKTLSRQLCTEIGNFVTNFDNSTKLERFFQNEIK